MSETKPKPAFKVWLETDEGFVFGPGVYSLLKKIKEKGNLKAAANSLDMSYRYAWGLIKRAEKKLGRSLIITYKGGKSGGGGADLTDVGIQFIEDFNKFKNSLNRILFESQQYEVESLPSRVNAEIKEILVEGDNIDITVQIEEPKIQFRISNKAFETLNINKGDKISIELTIKDLKF